MKFRPVFFLSLIVLSFVSVKAEDFSYRVFLPIHNNPSKFKKIFVNELKSYPVQKDSLKVAIKLVSGYLDSIADFSYSLGTFCLNWTDECDILEKEINLIANDILVPFCPKSVQVLKDSE